jgi:glutamate/tyrosine decarboxylase-like PLP-dependent enzyme
MTASFPEKGRPWASVDADIEHFKTLDTCHRPQNRITTGIHKGSDEIARIAQAGFNHYFHANALLADIEEGMGRMQTDVLQWTVDLLNGGPEGRASMMVGGSESIFCAVHAAREWARENRPQACEPYEIVMPRTGHAAFDKAAHYQGMTVKRVPAGPDFRADVEALESAVSDNTIMVLGSAPCWGFGLVDDIPGIGGIAERHGLWMHVDCCVGGFLLPFLERLGVEMPPFDFRVPAVCSISADLHKHGYTAKPASTVSFRSEWHQAFNSVGVAINDWQSGMYKSHGVVGSRPAGAISSAWAVMSTLGMEGYLEIARQSLDVKGNLVRGIESLADYKVLANEALLIPFRSETLDMMRVLGGLVERGYFPWGTIDPVYIHPSAEGISTEAVGEFLSDLDEVTAGVIDGTITAEAMAAYVARKGKPPEAGPD